MILNRKFYNQNTTKIAKDLLGCLLVRKYKGKIVKAMITETEAYRGVYDLASHASRGRTKRTEIMFGGPGYAHIYMIYGMYFMLNVVTEEKDFPAAVLIRGIQTPSVLRTSPPWKGGENLDGPGKLTKFLRIDKSLNGHDLTKGEKLWLESRLGHRMSKLKITRSPRVGIDYARHCKEWKWNFKITNY